MSDYSEDSPGVAGLAQLGRNAIERVTELERALAERDETIRKLRDPVVVHVAMLHEQMVAENLAWLSSMPQCPERVHINARCRLRKLEFFDVVAEGLADQEFNDPAARVDAEFTLMALELRGLIARLDEIGEFCRVADSCSATAGEG